MSSTPVRASWRVSMICGRGTDLARRHATARFAAVALLLAAAPAAAADAGAPVAPAADGAAPTAASCTGADALPASTTLRGLRGTIVCLLRVERRRLGVGNVEPDPRLALAGHHQAADMVRDGFFGHVAPDGERLPDRLAFARWIPKVGHWDAGEILAYGTGKGATPEAFVKAWIASPTHLAVLRQADFSEIGVGLARGTPSSGPAGLTAAVEFGRR